MDGIYVFDPFSIITIICLIIICIKINNNKLKYKRCYVMLTLFLVSFIGAILCFLYFFIMYNHMPAQVSAYFIFFLVSYTFVKKNVNTYHNKIKRDRVNTANEIYEIIKNNSEKVKPTFLEEINKLEVLTETNYLSCKKEAMKCIYALVEKEVIEKYSIEEIDIDSIKQNPNIFNYQQEYRGSVFNGLNYLFFYCMYAVCNTYYDKKWFDKLEDLDKTIFPTYDKFISKDEPIDNVISSEQPQIPTAIVVQENSTSDTAIINKKALKTFLKKNLLVILLSVVLVISITLITTFSIIIYNQNVEITYLQDYVTHETQLKNKYESRLDKLNGLVVYTDDNEVIHFKQYCQRKYGKLYKTDFKLLINSQKYISFCSQCCYN